MTWLQWWSDWRKEGRGNRIKDSGTRQRRRIKWNGNKEFCRKCCFDVSYPGRDVKSSFESLILCPSFEYRDMSFCCNIDTNFCFTFFASSGRGEKEWKKRTEIAIRGGIIVIPSICFRPASSKCFVFLQDETLSRHSIRTQRMKEARKWRRRPLYGRTKCERYSQTCLSLWTAKYFSFKFQV